MLILVALLVFLVNLPMGLWRSKVKKFSFKWFLAIHLPIPVMVLLRIYSGIGFGLITYPVMIGAYFLGQFIGARYLSFVMPKYKL